MKKSKFLWGSLLALTLVLTACGSKNDATEASQEDTTAVESAVESADVAESTEAAGAATGEQIQWDDNSLYLVTDLGTIDDKSFNQGAFQGLEQFANEIGVKANYIRPQGQGDQVYLQAIEQAIQQGAKVVVTPGYLFEVAVGTAQKDHPDVKFIAVDFTPQRIVEGQTNEDGSPVKEEYFEANTTSILFKEEQSGYLAGYAAVKDGYTKLGFAGGVAVPAVVRYGFGFLAGADAAAKEMNVNPVELTYNYTGSFEPTPEIQTMAATWYTNGTQVIFSCGGGIGSSVLKAAMSNDGKMIGVDVDQKDMGEAVITSAMKNLQSAVYQSLVQLNKGEFVGGKSEVFGAAEDGVQISEDFSRFQKFTQEDYTKIFEALKANTDGIADKIPAFDPSGDPTTIAGEFSNIKLNYVK